MQWVESSAVTASGSTGERDAFPPDGVWWRRLAGCLVAVFVLGSASVLLAPTGSNVAVWWPPAGLSVAMVLWTRRGRQAVTLLGVLVAVTAVGLVTGRGPLLSLAFGLANTAEVLVAAAAYGLGRKPPALRGGRDFVRLVVATGSAAGTAGLVAAVGMAMLTDGPAWTSGRTMVMSHGAAILVITPLFMSHAPRTWHVPRLEAVAQPLALAAVVLATFVPHVPAPTTALAMPFVAWGAARFGMRAASVQLLVVAVVASLLTGAGRGPFHAAAETGLAPEVTAALLQANLVALALITLPLALLTTQLSQVARRALSTTEDLQGILDAASRTAIVATDREGVVTYFSSGAQHVLGWSADEVVGRATPPGWDASQEPLQKQDCTWVTRSGEALTMSLGVSRRYDSSRTWVGWLYVAEDVTAERAAAAALHQAREREQAAARRDAQLQRSKADFVASVSHELRTPLAVIVATTELLLEGGYGPLHPDLRPAVERIDRNAHRQWVLVEELLGLSSSRLSHFGNQAREVDLAELAARVVASMQTAAQRGGVRLELEETDAPARVHGDAAQLEHALRHLMSNAIKHTPPCGCVCVTLGADHGTTTLEVRDTGSGISPEDVPHIFDRFYRSASSVRDALPGLGVGLAYVHAIVTGHGGTVTVDTEQGRGSTFTITVPVEPAAVSTG